MSEKAIMTGSFPDRGPAVFAVTVSTLVIGTVFFLARMISRIWIVKRVTCDDYIMIVAWILATGLTIAIDVGTSFGLGKHDANISAEQRLPLRKTEYVFSVLYVCGITMAFCQKVGLADNFPSESGSHGS